VLIDAGVRTRLADACAERAETFSMDTLAQRYLELYDQAAHGRGTSILRAGRDRARSWSAGRRRARSGPAPGKEAGPGTPG
jgi:hypothetical protein